MVIKMGEAVAALAISLLLFIIGLAIVLPILGYPGLTISTSHLVKDTKTVTITRHGTPISAIVPSTFTETHEDLRVLSAYAEYIGNGWNVKVEIKNTGVTDATITEIYVNNEPYEHVKITLSPNETRTLIIFLPKTKYSPGQMVSIKVKTTSGREYPATVTLP